MPRPNPPRPLRGEASLARRVAYERQRAGMSMEGLAKRMTDLGCAINQSAIWKIENGNPPRRITYDEALALAEVFHIPLEDLAVPPEVVADQTALQLIDDYQRARRAHSDAFAKLYDHIAQHPDVRRVLEQHVAWDLVTNDEITSPYMATGPYPAPAIRVPVLRQPLASNPEDGGTR
ncbi:MAG TPA: helix-turn-helix transcriptional regulator [Asanoa sp.]